MTGRTNDWIDVSVPVRDGMVAWPGDPRVEVDRVHSVEEGDVATVSHLSIGSHTGTHMDAPVHFIPGAETMDAVPWDVVMGPARVLHLPGVATVTAAALQHQGIGRGERVLLKTDNSTRPWWQEGFREDFVHLDPEAARYLAHQGVRLVGVDYLSVSGFADDPALVHRALLESRVWIVEGLNLADVEPGPYEIVCLPLKVAGADGAPSRVLLRRREQK